MVENVDIDIQRGDAVTVPFEFEDSPGVPSNLTGVTLVLTYKKRIGASTTNLIITNIAQGLAELRLTAAQTLELREGDTNDYKLQWVQGSVPTTVLRGNLLAKGAF